MAFDTSHVRELLQEFDFATLFNELGWSLPTERRATLDVDGASFDRTQIAQLSGVVVYELTATDGAIPDAKTRRNVHAEISKLHHENLLIFLDRERTRSLWYWAKREQGKLSPRDHPFMRGQPADLFLQKLSAMVVDISEMDEAGNVAVTEVASKLKGALDVERVTKKFYAAFREQHLAFLEQLTGIDDEHDRRWYASVLLNRLMFIYFLQSKGFIKGHTPAQDYKYLQNELKQSQARGANLYYSEFLDALFFEGFAKPETARSEQAVKLIGGAPYLNGGLFLKHGIESRWPNITVADAAFANLFRLFESYSWNLNDTPGGKADEINPDVLGYIFEKYINQKAFGAYYTRTEITQYLCEQTIYKLILDRINAYALPPAHGPHTGELFTVKDHNLFAARRFDSLGDLLLNLDSFYCRKLLHDILPDLKLLDPACGSGAFLVAAMKTLVNIYQAIVSHIEFHGDAAGRQWLERLRREHSSLSYYVKREIIKNNLFGVDIMEEATEIAKLRLFLALVAAVEHAGQLESLPNIDFNILTGHSLIGLLRIDESEFDERHAQGNLFQKAYRDFVRETTNDIRVYRQATSFEQDLRALRDNIETKKREVTETLDEILLDGFHGLGIRFEQATWDASKNKEGKSVKRRLTIDDIRHLRPFHWGFEFDDVMNKAGGFDAIITNPPWEVFQTNEKEFFQEYVPEIQKKKLRIEDWQKQQAELVKDSALKDAWLDYASKFSHLWAYFKRASQFANQTTVINGKAVGNKPNLYSLFSEQCVNLLRDGGYCGIVLPSGIYTDLGTKQLREMLFGENEVTGLFGFENRKIIFEGVDSRFKFVVLTFRKGGQTKRFPAAFMRHETKELERFPEAGALHIPVDLIRQLSPDSFSVPEFKDERELHISNRLLKNPLLSNSTTGWSLELYGEELNMTRSAAYFQTTPTDCPVYEGGMIWHFDHKFSEARYWIRESDLRASFLQKRVKRIGIHKIPSDLKNDYEAYRLAIRKIASNTNERTLICAVIPPFSFAGNSLTVNFPFCQQAERYNMLQMSYPDLLVLTSLLNSFVVDYVLRSRMTTNLNLFYLYQLPVPRLTEADKEFAPIVSRAARLICTTPEFDELAQSVGLKDHTAGAHSPEERAQLRAELDGIIAHLYGLTETEFAYILSTFPLVAQAAKDAALDQFRRYAPVPNDEQLAANIRQGETDWQELKVAACWNNFTNKRDDSMRSNVVEAVASFLNSREGGAVILGVDSTKTIIGLEDDYKNADPKQPGVDGYERYLRQALNNRLGGEHAALYKFTFHHVGGKQVCRIRVEPSPKPVFLDGYLIIRDGNGKRKLTAQEAIAYQRQHWS